MSELVRLAKEALKQQRALDPVPTMRAGEWITWIRADLKVERGMIDFLYHDADGTMWAFYTLADGTLGALNTKYVLKIDREATDRMAPA